MDSYSELLQQKEQSDKLLLKTEMVLEFISLISFFALIFVAMYIEMTETVRAILVTLGILICAAGTAYSLKIEQIAGYYECEECHNRYIPSYKSVFFAPHIGRTRCLKCPRCGKKSWHKKVLTTKD